MKGESMDLIRALENACVPSQARKILLQQAQLIRPALTNIQDLGSDYDTLQKLLTTEYFGYEGSMAAAWPDACVRIRTAIGWVLNPMSIPDMRQAASHAGSIMHGLDREDTDAELELLADAFAVPRQVSVDDYPF